MARFCSEPTALHAVYDLTVGDRTEISVEKMSSLRKFEVLANGTCRVQFLEGLPQRHSHFNSVSVVVDTTRVRRLIRPRVPFLLHRLVDQIEKDLQRWKTR